MRVTQKTRLATAVILIAVSGLLVGAVPAFAASSITGTGATFPQFLYQKWAAAYHAANPSVQISYTGTGSGAGIQAIQAGTVDFGASDAPLAKAALNQSKLVQFPTCVGGIVPIVNIPGVGTGRLKLSGHVLARIYLGEITKWNNPEIRSLNSGLNLPNESIKVIYRADSSGTTWNFTTYLSRVSSTWAGDVGISKSPAWPVGIGGNKSDGVANLVKTEKYSIGYIEYAYAKTYKIAYAQMRNRAGKWVLPSSTSFAAAAAGAPWSWNNGFYTVLATAKGTGSWPMTAATFVLVRRTQASKETGNAMLRFFDWAYRVAKAKAAARSLDFVSMPPSVVTKVEAVWRSFIKASRVPCWP
jgi:phosphate transport system substrate-binding protein